MESLDNTLQNGCVHVYVVQGIMILVGGWKSPLECVVSSPWKQIMSRGTSNASHNEISYPGYDIYMNLNPSQLRKKPGGFLSLKSNNTARRKDTERLQLRGTCKT